MSDYSGECYIKVFNNFDSAKQFIQEIGKQGQTIYFKYVEQILDKRKIIQKKQIDNETNQYNLIIAEKKTESEKEDQKKIKIQKDQKDKKEKKEYQQFTYTRQKYEKIEGKNKKYWLEGLMDIRSTNKNIQIQLSCLYEIVNNNFDQTRNSITQSTHPSVIQLYFISKKETIIQNFIQQFNGNKDNFIQRNFLNDIGSQILHLGKEIKNFNNLTSQVNGLTKDILVSEVIPYLQNYKYTIKINGMRTLLIIDEQNKSVFVLQAGGQNVFQVGNQKYTVLDCEEYENKFYVFDILIVNGEDVTQESYTKRLQILDNYKLPKNCVKKQFFEIKKLTDLAIAYEDIYDGISIDGVILNEMNMGYHKTKAYKLKNKKHLTNDFLAKLIPPSQLSNDEKKLMNYQQGDIVYRLYCGADHADFAIINNYSSSSNKYQPMPFAVPYFKVQPTEYMILNEKYTQFIEKTYTGEQKEEILNALKLALKGQFDDQIVECAYNDDLQPFPYKLRTDKTAVYKTTKSIFGNNFKTVLSNFNNIMDPITLEYLTQPSLQYFNVKTPDSKYDQFRTFGQNVRVSAFKATLSTLKKLMGKLEQFSYINALDYGAGRNSDYYLFSSNGFNTVIAYEPDRKNNIIYYERIISYLQRQVAAGKRMPLTYIVLDGYAENKVKRQLSINKINFFQSNYVIHYLCESAEKIKILKQMILEYSCDDAVFQFTDYDYYPLLKKYDGLYDNGKYHIKLLNSSIQKQEPFGQKIEVLMSWISQDMTYEYIVNVPEIQKIFLPEIKLIQTIHHADEQKIELEADKEYLNCIYTYIFQITRKQ